MGIQNKNDETENLSISKKNDGAMQWLGHKNRIEK